MKKGPQEMKATNRDKENKLSRNGSKKRSISWEMILEMRLRDIRVS